MLHRKREANHYFLMEAFECRLPGFDMPCGSRWVRRRPMPAVAHSARADNSKASLKPREFLQLICQARIEMERLGISIPKDSELETKDN